MLYRIEKVVSACDIHYMENLPKYQLIDKDWIINTLELVSNKKIIEFYSGSEEVNSILD